jgi:hypothetical protein
MTTEVQQEVQQNAELEIMVPERILIYLFSRIEQLKAENAGLKTALVPTLTREA